MEWRWGVLCLATIFFKAVQLPKSQCVTGTANNSGEEKVSHMLEFFGFFLVILDGRAIF